MIKIKAFFQKILIDIIKFLKNVRKYFYVVLTFIINLYFDITYYVYSFIYKYVLTKWKRFKNKEYKKPIKRHYQHIESIFKTDTYRLIKTTKTRFISLVAIVFIGTAFMMGLLSSASVMRKSIDTYDDDKNLQDIQIYSNYGFCEGDIEALSQIEGVEDVEGSKYLDCYGLNQNNEKYVVRVQELDSTINQITLVEGRWPEKENECLALQSQYGNGSFQIGDEFKLLQDEEDDLKDSLKIDTYTIVGLVKTPQYLSEFLSNSTFHNLTLDSVLFVKNENLISEYYTTVYLTITSGKIENSFSDDYTELIAEYIKDVEDLAVEQKDVNKNEIVAKAKEKIEEARAELDANKAEYEAKFTDAKEQLDAANIEIEVGKATIENSEKTIEETQAELDEQEKNLAASSEQLNSEVSKIESQYGKTFDELYSQISALYSAYYAMDSLYDGSYNAKLASEAQQKIDEFNKQLDEYEIKENECKQNLLDISSQMNEIENNEELSQEDKQTQISELQEEYKNQELVLSEIYNEELKINVEKDAYEIQLEVINGSNQEVTQKVISQIRKKLDEMAGGSVNDSYNGLLQIKTYQIQIEQGEQTIAQTRATLEASKSQIDEAKVKISNGEKQYNSSLVEYNKSLEEYNKEIEKAEIEIKKAEQDLQDLSEGQWTILDRDSHYSSALYKANSSQMQNIGIAFPILFFLVAALVCMTTMSRLIDEQRGQIGCLVALGYDKKSIIAKYVTYAGLASFAGALPGVLFGIVSFPIVIYSAWGMMYHNPKIDLYMPLIPTLISFFSFIVLMCVVTYFVAKSALKEIPAALLRPKAPKNMQKTFLERITFIWKRLSFTSKITARNIIRYKQRFFMTVIGVAGCCGLLLIGFGITDSISSIVNDQYGGFLQMSHQVTFENYEDADEIVEYVEDEYLASNISKFLSYTTLVKNDKEEATATMVVSDEENLLNYLNLKNDETDEAITFSNTGVVITKKFALNNNLKVGDVITLESYDGIKAEVHVEAIATMYYNHFIYMTSELYYDLFETTAHPNNITFITSEDAEKVSEELLMLDSIETVTNVNELTSTFNSMISSLGLITLVIILSAGFLALIVLINLTEVNISERRREIATLKVLGFRPIEVRNYIYKELIILTLIGSIAGIPLGNFGLKFIMDVLNIDMVFFPNVIKPISYVYAIATTYCFLAIILYIEAKPLKNLQMIESLKSVE